MALRDFDRVREKMVFRLEVRHVLLGCGTVAVVVAGAFYGGYRLAHERGERPQLAEATPPSPLAVDGLLVDSLPRPAAPMRDRRPPIVPRAVSSAASADAGGTLESAEGVPLAPTLAALARGGRVAAARELARSAIGGADEIAEDPGVAVGAGARAEADDAPAAGDATVDDRGAAAAPRAVATAAAPRPAAPAELAPAVVMSEPAVAPERASSQPDDEFRHCLAGPLSWATSADGRATMSAADAGGQSEELDPRATSRAVIDPDGYRELARDREAEARAAAEAAAAEKARIAAAEEAERARAAAAAEAERARIAAEEAAAKAAAEAAAVAAAAAAKAADACARAETEANARAEAAAQQAAREAAERVAKAQAERAAAQAAAARGAAGDRGSADGARAVALPRRATGTASRGRAVEQRLWYVQIKSLRSETEARAFQAELRAKGWRTAVQRADIDGQGVFYRIRLGPYDAIERAQAVAARLLKGTGHEAMVMSSKPE